MANRLALETSPYLKQHEHNPVDWYPWGDEALARAKAENKPILLSVGYSACHWCHVMAHESFEDVETARLMNEGFINIKVDREERPDLDQIYQNVAQLFTQGGGWPLTVFLTPDLKPFFGGTYFPPEDRYGRPGFKRVLQSLADAYRKDIQNVLENAGKVVEAISTLESVEGGAPTQPTQEALIDSAKKLLSYIDWTDGGLGGAPKFPNPMIFSFLWRTGCEMDLEDAREAVVLTLDRMASGGIYDQLGGGFSRYSVDAHWSVPHFEKMLYDNALLLKLYAEVLVADSMAEKPRINSERQALFLRVLRETVDYIGREMTSPEGAFYTAQDADSEGEEGKFFVWDLDEIKSILAPDEARVIASRYGVSAEGNFEHGKTVLYLAAPVAESDEQALSSGRKKLFDARERRIKPGLDNKVLASWNGLMVSGLVWAGIAFRHFGERARAEKALGMAQRAFHFLESTLQKADGRLYSTYQGGKPKLNAYLDDYAFLAQAALDLARVQRSPKECQRLIRVSESWCQAIQNRFKDPRAPGYFFTSDDHEALLQRPKSIYDPAIPSGTSVALGCLAALVELDPRSDGGASYAAELEYQLRGLFPQAQKNPFGHAELLCASLLTLLGPVTVSGGNADEVCRHPHVFQKGSEADSSSGDILICHQKACGLPVREPGLAIRQALEKTGMKIAASAR